MISAERRLPVDGEGFRARCFDPETTRQPVAAIRMVRSACRGSYEAHGPF